MILVFAKIISLLHVWSCVMFFFFQAEDGIRDLTVTGVQTCALPISRHNDPLRDGSQSALAISAPGFAPNPRWPGNRASRTARPPRRSPAPWTNDGASLGPGGDRKSAGKTRGANESALSSVYCRIFLFV